MRCWIMDSEVGYSEQQMSCLLIPNLYFISIDPYQNNYFPGGHLRSAN